MKRQTLIKWARRLLLAVLIAVFTVLFVILPVGASYLITNGRFRFPERNPKRPEDLGLLVSPVEFAASDGIALRGWWNGGDASKPVIIFCHGLNRSRLELLERAADANKRGYGILAFDLRNHGESADAYTTLGVRESQDVCAAGEFVRSSAPERPRILWGVSLGASTAILGARRCGGFSAVISDSAFLSFRDTISHHFRLIFGLPSFPIANVIITLTSLRMGFDPDEGDVEAAVRDLDVPMMFIAGSEDRRMPPDVARRMFAASRSERKDLLVVEGAGHGDAFETAPQLYMNSVYKFLEQVRYNPAPNGNSDKGGRGNPINGSSPGSTGDAGRIPGSNHQ